MNAPEKPFEDVWQELEKRHAWNIRVAEWKNPKPAVSRMPFCWSDYDNRFAAAFRERYRLQEVIAGARDDWAAILRLGHWTFVNVAGWRGAPYAPAVDVDNETGKDPQWP
jgi:hypothetical protein